MQLGHDSWLSLRAAIDLINSGQPPSQFDDDWIDSWWTEHRYTGHRSRSSAELRALAGLRAHLRRLLLLERADAALEVNRVLIEADATPQLRQHGEVDWHIHAVPDDAPLERRVLVETAMAVADLVRLNEMSRIAVCADTRCERLLLDSTRNRTRRYCSPTCTNRNAAAAYRRRQRPFEPSA